MAPANGRAVRCLATVPTAAGQRQGRQVLRIVIGTDGFLEPETTPPLSHDVAYVRHDDVAALASALGNADALVTRRVWVNEDLLGHARRLRLVQQVGIGTDRIDLSAAGRLAIRVANTPEATSNAVAEHCFMLVLAALRGLVWQVESMRVGGWSGAEVWSGEEIGGKTVGILGFGSIGADLARRFLAFGAGVLVHTRTVPAEGRSDIAFVDLPTLMRASDIVVIAAGLNASTKGMVGRSEITAMKRDALLVNIARGAIVDEEAMLDALRNGRIRAALDAYAKEPLPVESPLRSLDNVVQTPHSAGSSRQSRERIWNQMLANLDRLADGRDLLNVVNLADMTP
ncbi:hydroxyacid dehydrogenase [Mesorhizobium sp. B2-1-5]|nr:hydroxyacid dehydrogenase [Mesorhizobium sp. B2-1-5]